MSSADRPPSEVPLTTDAYWGRVASSAGIAAVAVAAAYLLLGAVGIELQIETKGNQWVNAGFCQLFTNPFDDVDYTSDLPSITLALAVSQAFGMSLLGGIFGFLLTITGKGSKRTYQATAVGVYLVLGVLVALQAGTWATGLGLWLLHTLVLLPGIRWVGPAIDRIRIASPGHTATG